MEEKKESYAQKESLEKRKGEDHSITEPNRGTSNDADRWHGSRYVINYSRLLFRFFVFQIFCFQ